MTAEFEDKEETKSWVVANAVYLVPLTILAVMAAAGWFLGYFFIEAPRELPKRPTEVVVNLVPPPPPQPKPKETPPPEQKMIEAAKPTDAPDAPQDEIKPEPLPDTSSKDEPPPGPLSLDAVAEGPGDSFNLGSRLGGRGLLGGGGGGSAEGRYSALMIREIKAVLERNDKIKNSVLQVRLRLWLDQTGRLTRLDLAQSTGNSELDAELKAALSSLAFSQPPPKSIPMPITTSVIVQRPG